MRKSFCTVVLLVSLATLGRAQDLEPKRFRIIEKGFLIGVGHGIDSLNLPEGNYVPTFFIGHIGFSLTKKPNSNKGIFTFNLEPQLNPVFIRKAESSKTELEFGLNMGFQHIYPITKNIYSYILISAGPHFISVNTVRLARGFCFSDNLGAGLYVALNKSLRLNLGFRLRHLSNAELKSPNHGINTFNYHIGLSKALW
ncbi:MAG TPA: acyloxyacyl hydrolase [Cytophagaceae bacterium]